MIHDEVPDFGVVLLHNITLSLYFPCPLSERRVWEINNVRSTVLLNLINYEPACTIWAGYWHNQLTGVKATCWHLLIIDWLFVGPELSCVRIIRLCQSLLLSHLLAVCGRSVQCSPDRTRSTNLTPFVFVDNQFALLLNALVEHCE